MEPEKQFSGRKILRHGKKGAASIEAAPFLQTA
jgi:hypothetical protein